MKHHLSLIFVLFAFVSVSAFFLFHTQADALYYDDLEESSQVISVVCGEKITLKKYASSTGRDSYRIGNGTGSATFNNENINEVLFTSAGSLMIHDDVKDALGNVISTKTWTFNIVDVNPIITQQPVSQTVSYQDSVSFSVETRQDSCMLTYQWFIVQPNKLVAYPKTVFPEVENWNLPTLTIPHCELWMNGVHVYCIVSSSNNLELRTYTENTNLKNMPTLTVNKKPISSSLTVTDLDYPIAKVPLDYDFRILENDYSQENYNLISVSTPEYSIDGVTVKNDKDVCIHKTLDVSFLVSLKDKTNYCFPDELKMKWGDMLAEEESVNSYTHKFTYHIPIEDQNPLYISDVVLYFEARLTASLPETASFNDDRFFIESLYWKNADNKYQVICTVKAKNDYFFDDTTYCSFVSNRQAQIDSCNGSELTFSYTFDLNQGEDLIYVQPVDVSCLEYENPRFEVRSFGSAVYQWYMQEYGSEEAVALSDNEIFTGTQTNSLQVAANLELDYATFYCMVNETKSDEVLLKVHINPNPPKDASITEWASKYWSELACITIALIIVLLSLWFYLKDHFGPWYKAWRKKR